MPDLGVPQQQFPVWAAALIALLIGSGLFMTWRSMNQAPPKPAIPTATPTQTPTPTPVRELSLIASQSAFLSLQNEVASLSGALQNYVVDDPSLSPPTIDLSLGLTQ